MGNVINIPEKMKELPNQLNKNEYVEITTRKGKFYVFSRSFFGRIGGSFQKGFSSDKYKPFGSP
jgi:hypothetical protein